jgi:hypothetical protein
MAICQESPLDMLMYYDARPCGMNGMFDTDFYTPLKGYYPFKMFGELYRLGGYVRPDYTDDPIYCTAAANEDCGAIMVTNFSDDDSAPTQEIELEIRGAEGKKVSVYMLDGERDMELVSEREVIGKLTLSLPLFATAFLKIS